MKISRVSLSLSLSKSLGQSSCMCIQTRSRENVLFCKLIQTFLLRTNPYTSLLGTVFTLARQTKGENPSNIFCVLNTISLVWHSRTMRKAVAILRWQGCLVVKTILVQRWRWGFWWKPVFLEMKGDVFKNALQLPQWKLQIIFAFNILPSGDFCRVVYREKPQNWPNT